MTTATRARPKDRRHDKTRRQPSDDRTPEQQVADRILELLDSGQLPPWQQGWDISPMGQPRNAVSDKPYRGINQWLTLITNMIRGYQDPRWVTFKQAADLGGHVMKGEKSTAIVFWKIIDKPGDEELKDGEVQTIDQGNPETQEGPRRRRFPMARMYRVFNIEQTAGCELPALEKPARVTDSIAEAEAIIASMPNPPGFETYANLNQPPHYVPAKDLVRVPDRNRYEKTELYYNTVFHELTHATGHPSRLNRAKSANNSFQSHDYGVEELVAGMGAAMLGDKAGIGKETVEADAAYIKHWRDVIAGDKAMVLRAAQQAQKAVDYICGTPADGQQQDQPQDQEQEY